MCKYVCLSVYVFCTFSFDSFFLFIYFAQFWFVYFYFIMKIMMLVCFLIRERKGVNLVECVENWGGPGGGKNVIRIYCMKEKSIFN